MCYYKNAVIIFVMVVCLKTIALYIWLDLIVSN